MTEQAASTAGARLRDEISAISGTVERLTEQSRVRYQNPYEALTWPEEVNPAEQWFFTPN